MENLHLKNLTTNKIIDYYIYEIDKINKRNNNFKSANTVNKILNNNTDDIIKDFQTSTNLLTKLCNVFIIELKRIDILNPQIKEYRSHTISYIEDIIQYELKELTIHNYINNYFYKEYERLTNIFKYEIDQLKLLKDIDINSKWIDIDYEYHYHTRTNSGEEYLNMVVFELRNHLTTLTHDLIITIDENNNIIKEIDTNHR